MVSPLRYPGGKGALYSPLRRLIRDCGLAGCTYVEPYAGGAGAGLSLLVTGQVDRVVINDLDPAVYAFWRSLFDDPAAFVQRVQRVKLNVSEWKRQRAIYVDGDRSDIDALGFATFYLNRTNHSGVLNGGPIGGHDQSGTYKIDARFNRPELSERMRVLGLYADRIDVTCEDGATVIAKYGRRSGTFIYADPPYFEKAGSLYMNAFQPEDHVALARALNRIAAKPWLLTYDNVPQVGELYAGRQRQTFGLNYSAHRVTRATEVAVFSDAVAAASKQWSEWT